MNDLDVSLLFASAVAGGLYVLAPGPAVLALIGIGADQGRVAGARFVIGHLVGDVLWCGLALVAIIGARDLDPSLFDGLSIVCGLYLGWLGYRSVTVRRSVDGAVGARTIAPLRRGVLFGVTNPKSYPVAVAMFTALLADQAASLNWEAGPVLLAAAFGGFLIADVILVWVAGLAPLRALYRKHAVWIIRGTGVLFLGFAAHALANGLHLHPF